MTPRHPLARRSIRVAICHAVVALISLPCTASSQEVAPPDAPAEPERPPAAELNRRRQRGVRREVTGFPRWKSWGSMHCSMCSTARTLAATEHDSNLSSIKRNLRSKWGVDSDSFTINQLGHPYQGSMYHGFARALGFNYPEGLTYTFLGSAFWEIAGETTPPSKNDQISTGIGGSFLGEALFGCPTCCSNKVEDLSSGVS